MDARHAINSVAAVMDLLRLVWGPDWWLYYHSTTISRVPRLSYACVTSIAQWFNSLDECMRVHVCMHCFCYQHIFYTYTVHVKSITVHVQCTCTAIDFTWTVYVKKCVDNKSFMMHANACCTCNLKSIHVTCLVTTTAVSSQESIIQMTSLMHHSSTPRAMTCMYVHVLWY